jgi:hypothetical protein
VVKRKIFKNRLLGKIFIPSRKEKPCDIYCWPDISWQVKEDQMVGHVRRMTKIILLERFEWNSCKTEATLKTSAWKVG